MTALSSLSALERLRSVSLLATSWARLAEKANHCGERPNMIGDAGLHRRGHADGLTDPTRVVPHEVGPRPPSGS